MVNIKYIFIFLHNFIKSEENFIFLGKIRYISFGFLFFLYQFILNFTHYLILELKYEIIFVSNFNLN